MPKRISKTQSIVLLYSYDMEYLFPREIDFPLMVE